jgi:hypothetical protein
MLVSSSMSRANVDRLGIDADWKLPGLTDEHQPDLEYHRASVFRR